MNIKYFPRLRQELTIVTFVILLLASLSACEEPAAAPSNTTSSQPLYTNPKLGVAPATISLQFTEGQSKTESRKITIANEGEGVMIWAATKRASWMWMNENSGALEKGYNKTLEVFFAPAGLSAGTYTDNLTIEGVGTRNSPFNVVVTMLVKPPAVTPTDDNSVMKKPVPPPPWEYNEYINDTYHFRLRYPKDYREKQISAWNFGAVSVDGTQTDTILMNVASTYGTDLKSFSIELTKGAIRAAGGNTRSDPKLIESDNTTTLSDGVTPAYEYVYEARTTSMLNYQVYIFGTQKASRLIFFVGCAPDSYAEKRVAVWKQIAQTLEFLSRE